MALLTAVQAGRRRRQGGSHCATPARRPVRKARASRPSRGQPALPRGPRGGGRRRLSSAPINTQTPLPRTRTTHPPTHTPNPHARSRANSAAVRGSPSCKAAARDRGTVSPSRCPRQLILFSGCWQPMGVRGVAQHLWQRCPKAPWQVILGGTCRHSGGGNRWAARAQHALGRVAWT